MSEATTTNSRYRATLNSVGNLVLTPAPGRDPEELRHFGALPQGRYWTLPNRLADIELMSEAGIIIEVPDHISAELRRQDKLTRYLQSATDLEKAADHPVWSTLLPHQRVGVGYLASRDRALLSFTPGLGKSATAIVTADVMKYQRILVIAPLTLLPTWKREITMWSTDPAMNVLRKDYDTSQRWSIINPERLNSQAAKSVMTTKWDLVIMDESILYKNRNAKRTKRAQELADRSKVVWLLSGAPVAAYADDLYAQLAILLPRVFRSYWRFVAHWCFTKVTPWATDIVGNRNPERLRHYLRDVMLSRTPDDVPGLLPETQFEVVDVDLGKKQTKLLEQIVSELAWDDDDGDRNTIAATIAKLTRVSQALSCPQAINVDDLGAKIPAAVDLVKNEIAQLPAIVWVHYRETGEQAQKTFSDAGYRTGLVHGGVSAGEREKTLADFQEGNLDVLVLQIQTGKFGLSLTEANSVVFVDRSFSFDDWTQSIARVRRLSSKGKVVPTYVLHGGWSDNLVDVILNRKLKSVHGLKLSDLKQLIQGRAK